MLTIARTIRWRVLLLVVGMAAAMAYFCSQRLILVSDIVEMLPKNDPALMDAQYILSRYAPQNVVVLDIGTEGSSGDLDDLVDSATLIKSGLEKSGLFQNAGSETEAVLPLLKHVTDNLPSLFTAEDLDKQVAPLLSPGSVREALKRDKELLGGIEGLGQTDLVSKDPLFLREAVLGRMAALNPGKGGHVYRGFFVSEDWRHLLLIARSLKSSTDGVTARRIDNLVKKLAGDAGRIMSGRGVALTVTATGAYRSSMDNEDIARRGTERALTLSTIIICLILLLSTPRPFFGLAAMVPALFGTVAALFTVTLLLKSISIITLGFGGAIIAFTVDYGIVYIMLLSRREGMTGRTAAREIFSSGTIANLTTVGAFLALAAMSFPIYRELGVFSVLGIIYSFLFVQVLFPRIIPEVPPVGRKLRLPLEIVPQVMYRVSGRATFTVMLLLFCVMLSFARPVFHVDINDMNTITSGTMAAESEIKGRWGDPAGGTLLVAEGSSLAELMERIDALTEYVVSERKQGNVAAFFSPALLWPGKRLGAANISAWKNFFNSERVAELRKTLHDTATEFDFSDDAFDPFLRDVESPNASGSDWPAGTFTIFGVRRGLTGGQWMSAIRLAPSEPDAVEKIFRVTSANGMGRLLDAGRYARSLSSAVADTFKDMLLIIGLGNLLMLVIYFMDAQLVLLASAPIVFSVVCTLGTMNLMGHPLDIPSIIFMIVVLGMGIDYGLYFICSYQRYRDDRGGYYSSIIVAVFLAAVSTVAGFGCMALSGNKLLSSAGLITSLGLCYSLLGAFFIVPPILRLIYRPGTDHGEVAQAGSDRHRALVLRRYRHAETTPRMFARFKIMLDPMFARLGDFVKNGDRILDIGTGYGVPAVWLATCRSGLTIWGVEPESERARVAAAALGASGTVTCTGAPKLPDLLHPADVALMIDIAHYLSDQELGETLHGIAEKLAPGGRLVVRASVPRESKAFAPFHRALETFRLKICHRPCFYRAKSHIEDQLRKAGFAVESVEPSAPGREETWFLARSPGGSGKP